VAIVFVFSFLSGFLGGFLSEMSKNRAQQQTRTISGRR
jgi:hypothetical protein